MLRLPDFFPPLPDFPPGEVWLAGAGPGDPRLLTVLALHAVASADDIVHDALVDARVLTERLTAARLGCTDVLAAIHGYEDTMRNYAPHAALEAHAQLLHTMGFAATDQGG